MSTLTHIHGAFDRVAIRCEDDEPVIWITTRHDSVSLKLTADQLVSLEAAIEAARRFPLPVREVA